MSVRRVGAALLVVLMIALPAGAQVSREDLAEARADLERLRVELQALAADYEAALARDIQLGDDIEQLEGLIASRRIELRELRDRAQARAVELYIDAAGVGLATVFTSASPNEVGTRSEYLGDLGKADQAVFNGLQVLSIQLTAETDRLNLARIEQQQSLADLEAVAADVNERLIEAQATYEALREQFLEEERARLAEIERQRRLAEEEARRQAEEAARAATSTTAPPATEATTTTTTTTTAAEDTTTTTAPPAPPSGTRTCPVDGFTSFTDTWGAPRSGGRWHQGVDMLAAKGTPVVAVEAGIITSTRNSTLGGITVWLQGESGDTFYYAHLDSHASGISTGASVSLGQKLGEVGTSGNAPAHIPHLHWEYHPGGGGAVNPTPLARALCG